MIQKLYGSFKGDAFDKRVLPFFHECNDAYFSASKFFRLGVQATRKPGRSTVLLCALRFLSAPVLTLLKKRHEGVCHISHAVDASASSELKAR